MSSSNMRMAMIISMIPVSVAPTVAIAKVSIPVIPSGMGMDVAQITDAAPFHGSTPIEVVEFYVQ